MNGTSPATTAGGSAALQPATLARFEALLAAGGHDPSRDGSVVRGFCGSGASRVAITVQVSQNPSLAYLATNGWFHLSQTANDRGVVVLLTQIAALNYETPHGKLQLNPTSGEVILSVELAADDGLGDATMRAGLERLCSTAAALRPKLEAAVTSGKM